MESINSSSSKKGLTCFNKFAYSVGHMHNDLWATVWFMYLLYYLSYIVSYGPILGSIALLSGQIADGVATNLSGLLIDKTHTSIGKRTPWFIAGSILIIPSFLLTFNTWFLIHMVWGVGENSICSPDTYKFLVYLYFITLPALFNIGWAFVQISSMSLVVAITYDQKQRDSLISYRNSCTFGSNLLTLIMALYLFSHVWDAVLQFRILTLMITAFGLITSTIFLIGCPETKLSEKAITHGLKHAQWSAKTEANNVEDWRDWLKIKQFYAYCVVYALARLSINVTMTLTPFYLILVLKYEKRENEPTPPEIASVPLVSYFSSMIFTLFFSHYFNEFKRLHSLIWSLVLVTIGSVPFLILTPFYNWVVYLWVPIQGIGLAIGLNMSGSLMSDMIGKNKSSTFVYGTYSLVDKFASGLVLVLIGQTVIENAIFLRLLYGVMPILTWFFAWVFAYLGQENDYMEL